MRHRSWTRTLGFVWLAMWATLVVLPSAFADPGRQSRRGAGRQHARVVHQLPPGHVKVIVGQQPYFFHAGVFYRNATSGFSIIAGPIGARISVLPRGHRTIVVGGLDYYVYFGTYYRYFPDDRVYVVVEPPVDASGADVIYMLDGESMVGRFVGGNKTSVRFEVEGEVHHVPITEIVAIHFEPPPG